MNGNVMSEQLPVAAPVVAAEENKPVLKPEKSKKSWLSKISPLMWVTVIVPTLVSVVYFGVMASDRYTSQSSFVVRSPKSQSSLSGLGAILQGTGFTRAQEDIYTVQ